MNYSDFLKFVEERESIRIKKLKGLSPPWTEDYILQKTRFCNIDRIHDTGTIRLLDFISSLNQWEKIYYTVLYRSALSSKRFIDNMTGIWLHDYRNLKYTKMSISDARKPYQVFLHKKDTMQSFLVNVSSHIATFIFENQLNWNNVSILEVSKLIANGFKTLYGRNMIFLATEITKDLSYFLSIDADSECRMNIGARVALKNMGHGSIQEKVDELLIISKLNPSNLEHGLCEFGRYCTRWNYYKSTGTLKNYWRY